MREEIPVAESAPPAKPILEFDWQSDLTQVETDREKLKTAQARAQDEPPAVSPRKRERQPPRPVSDEPLVQVETGKPKAESDMSPAYGHSDSEVAQKAAAN